tara:strand:- start:1199 stop:1507 length:309 start_codon:yes stop_codon:yes gene_type:complete
MSNEMEPSAKPKEFGLPLELQFSMRKAEISAGEMTWEQLYTSLLNLYYQRLMEWHAIKALIAEENINIDFDIPTDVELRQLAKEAVPDPVMEDDDDPFAPLA